MHILYIQEGISRSIHRYWYAYFPLHTVFYCLPFSHLHRWQVFFWEADFELRLVWRRFIREGSGRGKRKEAGLGRGRSWSVMYSQQRPQLIPPKALKLGWPLRVVPRWIEGTDLHTSNWSGTGCWLALKEMDLGWDHFL